MTGNNTFFTEWLIPGDTINVQSQAAQIVTQVFDDTHLVISPGFSSSIPQSNPSALNTYSGYFVNPRPDTVPNPGVTGYPGGALAVTSPSNGQNGIVWGIIAADIDANQANDSSENNRTQGYLCAYQATPVTPQGQAPYLKKLWDSNHNCSGCVAFCAAPYAVPTVVQSMVYVATYAINQANETQPGSCPTDGSPSSSYDSGILVYGMPQ